MIDPRTVMVGIPCHDGKNMTELTGMLVTNRDLYAAITMPTECSHPSLVRNIMADTFQRSGLDWFVGIDSDIVPSRCDFQYLLETIDSSVDYAEDIEERSHPVLAQNVTPRPSRIDAATDSGTRTMADVLVCAEYAYKRDEFEPVQFGGGFYRAHKSVFSILANLKHPNNNRVEVDADILDKMLGWAGEDGPVPPPRSEWPAIEKALRASMTTQAGTPRIWQASHNGRLFYDFFPSGAMLSAGLPHGDWKGEDHGFWTLCALAGLVPRVERRTRLMHIGRKGYPYLGPDEGGGQ
jgi:hypothetical protein